MSDVLNTVCEHCDAKLKLKNPDLEGKKIKCPKCGEAFVVVSTDASTSAKPKKKKSVDDDMAFMDVDPDDYGAPPEEDEDADDHGDKPQRRSLRSGRGGKGKSKKKSRKGGGNSAQVVKILAIVAVALLVLGGGGYGMMVLTSGGSGGTSELDWLPTEIQGFVKFQADNVWGANILQSFRNGTSGQSLVAEMTKNVGMGPQDIDQVVVSINSSGAHESPVTVVRAKKPFDVAVLKASDASLTEVSHGTASYLKGKVSVMFLADSKTLVTGSESTIKGIIERGRRNPSDSKFAFAKNYRDHLVWAMLEPDKSPTSSSPGFSRSTPPFLRGTNTAVPVSALIRANASSDIRIAAQIAFKTAEESKASVDKNKADFEKAKADFAKQKSQLQNAPANPFMKPEQLKKMMDGMEQVMNNMQISQSGTRMNVNLTISGQMVTDLTDMAAASPFASPAGLRSLLPMGN